ncbi:hypothetical protein ACIA8K_22160 [Catenuloplanes sp. NPDC051500]|uniref:hypothetical protein n=1 Tax=Catenuloplanes sp. NPDC051500 TaxID=3363959 RepID=UPI0037B48569
MEMETKLAGLVARGVLDQAQAEAVAAEFTVPVRRVEGLRKRLAEVAGYLGASLVLGATVLIVGEHWEELGKPGRVAVLAALAVVLFGSALLARRGADAVRRRLAATLLTGATIAAAAAAHAALDLTVLTAGDKDIATWFAALVVAVAGYLLARGALGLLTAAVAVCGLYGALLDRFFVDESGAWGFGLVAMAALWAALGWFVLRADRRPALAIAVILAFAGGQIVIFSMDNLGRYAVPALVAAACFAAYLRTREWILLAGGVVGATVLVPEFLSDLTGGSLGPSGVMLAAGLTLLAAGLTSLRLHGRPTPAV